MGKYKNFTFQELLNILKLKGHPSFSPPGISKKIKGKLGGEKILRKLD
jgi:hypothetical protein